MLEIIVPAMGVGLCAIALFQLVLSSAHSLGSLNLNRRQFAAQSKRFREQIGTASEHVTRDDGQPAWSGFRNFRVERIVRETGNCTSLYLGPEDGKPIPKFRPGQHLTFRFSIAGQPKPVVRCYSLSDGPGKPYYRISVKVVPPPREKPQLSPGKASSYVNHELQVGQRLEVKAPSGNFYLNEDSQKPVVLLAGGVGITPMVSMIERLIELESDRMVLLAYGLTHGADHAFKDHLTSVSQQHENFHLLNCYSHPGTRDEMGIDYHVEGRVSADLLRQVLPGVDCEFYLCGPPAFMKSIYDGLLVWGVEESNIRFEAFGPASIGKPKTKSTENEATESVALAINFSLSDSIETWDGSHDSLLEFAEAHQIPMESGCRAGSCGTCSTQLLAGKVTYPDGQKISCDPGHCLTCIARPAGPLELDA